MLEICLRTVSKDIAPPQYQEQGQGDKAWLMDTMQNRRLLVKQRDQANQVYGKGLFYIAERPLGAVEQQH
jgi:hypothetical protein